MGIAIIILLVLVVIYLIAIIVFKLKKIPQAGGCICKGGGFPVYFTECKADKHIWEKINKTINHESNI